MVVAWVMLGVGLLVCVLISKRSGSQATNRDQCQPPLPFNIAHAETPIMSMYFTEPLGGGLMGGWKLPGDILESSYI